MTEPRHRALFLDRDGVINHEVGYLHRSEDVRWVDGVFSLCRRAKALDYRLVVVTNQAGIGRGLYTTEDFEALMRWMMTEFRAQGATLDAVYHCPFHPEHGVGAWRREHEDRKPALVCCCVPRGILGSICPVLYWWETGVRTSLRPMPRDCGWHFCFPGQKRACVPGSICSVQSLEEVKDWLELNS